MLFFLHLDMRLYVNSHFTVIVVLEIGFLISSKLSFLTLNRIVHPQMKVLSIFIVWKRPALTFG